MYKKNAVNMKWIFKFLEEKLQKNHWETIITWDCLKLLLQRGFQFDKELSSLKLGAYSVELMYHENGRLSGPSRP